MFKSFIFIYIAFGFAANASSQALPDPEVQEVILNELINKIEKFDGEALFVRKNRDDSWRETVSKIIDEGTKTEEPPEFIRALERIDQTYPNLHSYFESHNTDIKNSLPKKRIPAIKFVEVRPSEDKVEFVISAINQKANHKLQPQIGDRLLAINGRPMEAWLNEQFSFCKWPLKSQCGLTLFNNLAREYLSWRQEETLTYSVEHEGSTIDIDVQLVDYSPAHKDYSKYRCANFTKRYDGFQLAYQGNRACIYESPDYPDTAILRIISFQYNHGKNENPPLCSNEASKPIENIYDEVDCLRKNYWNKSEKINHLIIDILENGGGQAPIPYYKILFAEPFQEQWVRFRKNSIIENETLRKAYILGKQGPRALVSKY
ncbi:MAG: hypothetical protein R3B45_01155 [Bdellovibrionota bacterium]